MLVTGVNGQLGGELAPLCRALGDVVALDRSTLDLADADAIVATVRKFEPHIIVNAAAYTAVDRAESDRESAFAVNAVAPGVLADEAKKRNALLVHFSTDYVFDGRATMPYVEASPTAPLSVYGASKLDGETRVIASGANALVFRTSWVYGRRGSNFLLTIQRLAREREELRIVDDQIGVPNWSRALARATTRVLSLGPGELATRAGLYHLSCGGHATWFSFAQAFLRDRETARLIPIATSGYPTPATRPAYGVLDSTRFRQTFGFGLPDWRVSLDECLAGAGDPVS
ncbi:MAG TPA: dTDP-4-dehydrorhamnose reductase [Casimicrobiaceae bacterium]|nr:dTDP-4-dehydrorhamnose reductase [Casimicrobiaceae bacterium]